MTKPRQIHPSKRILRGHCQVQNPVGCTGRAISPSTAMMARFTTSVEKIFK